MVISQLVKVFSCPSGLLVGGQPAAADFFFFFLHVMAFQAYLLHCDMFLI